MAKYCINNTCPLYGQSQNEEDICCKECGHRLSSVSPVITGDTDDNSINVSRTVNDSHNNIDSHDTVHNVTNVYINKNRDELTLLERKDEYRQFCSERITTGIISSKLRRELNAFAAKLNLTEEQQLEIEVQIKDARLSANTEALSDVDIIVLSNVISQIKANKGILSSLKIKLEPFANSESDEAQFYYYMITALENPSLFITKYKKATVDNYWQTFWVCYAYTRIGQRIQTGYAQRKLIQWEEYPQENAILASCIDHIINKETAEAAQLLTRIHHQTISSLLEPLYSTVIYITEHEHNIQLSNSPECNFYLQNLFNIKNAKQTPHISQPQVSPLPNSTNTPAKPSSFNSVVTPKASDKAIQAANTAVENILNSSTKSTSHPITSTINIPHKRFNWKTLLVPIIIVCILIALLPGILKTSHNTTEQYTDIHNTPSDVNIPSTPIITDQSSIKKEHNNNITSVQSNNSIPENAPTSTSKVIESNAQETSAPLITTTSETRNNNVTAVTATTATRASNVSKTNTIETLKASAEQGDKDAQYALGMKYYNGDGVTRSYSTAFKYLKPLADEGYTNAYFPVAEMYHGGRGVAKDRDIAAEWYSKAAKAGNTEAQRILMNM